MRITRSARIGAGLALVVGAVGVVGGCGTDEPSAGGATTPAVTPSPPPSPEPTKSEPPAPSPTVTPIVVTPYYLVDTRAGIRLAREVRQTSGIDVVQAAVEQMIAGSADPDYSTAWDPETDVLGVTQSAGTITVDLSEAARTASIGSEGAATMIQQLVWTATEAAGDPAASVLLTIEGEPAGELWGAVSWTEPVPRADPLDVRMLVQLAEPREGITVTTSPVTVTGDAAAFEANVPWRVLDATGAEVTRGFATTSAGQEFAPFTFYVELEPGTWTVEISEDDPSDGAAGTPMTDTKTFTVS